MAGWVGRPFGVVRARRWSSFVNTATLSMPEFPPKAKFGVICVYSQNGVEARWKFHRLDVPCAQRLQPVPTSRSANGRRCLLQPKPIVTVCGSSKAPRTTDHLRSDGVLPSPPHLLHLCPSIADSLAIGAVLPIWKRQRSRRDWVA